MEAQTRVVERKSLRERFDANLLDITWDPRLCFFLSCCHQPSTPLSGITGQLFMHATPEASSLHFHVYAFTRVYIVVAMEHSYHISDAQTLDCDNSVIRNEKNNLSRAKISSTHFRQYSWNFSLPMENSNHKSLKRKWPIVFSRNDIRLHPQFYFISYSRFYWLEPAFEAYCIVSFLQSDIHFSMHFSDREINRKFFFFFPSWFGCSLHIFL